MKKTFLKTIMLLLMALCSWHVAQAQSLTALSDRDAMINDSLSEIEPDAYQEAIEANTREAYNNFLHDYTATNSRGKMVYKKIANKQHVLDVVHRLKDLNLWEVASNANTVASYNIYLQNSKMHLFDTNAKEGIDKLNAIKDWQQVSASNSIPVLKAYLEKYPKTPYYTEAISKVTELEWQQLQGSLNASDWEAFAKQYPQSSHAAEAQKKAHQLHGENYYKEGDLLSAYNEFTAAGGRSALPYQDASMYDASKEYYDYINLDKNDEVKLKAYLDSHPQGKYANEISNMYALALASEVNMYSSKKVYNNIYAYAKDNKTRSAIGKIQGEMHHKRIMEDGGYVQLAFSLDGGYNVATSDSSIYYINAGVGVRFGNFMTPVQFEVGVLPGMLAVGHSSENKRDEYGNRNEDKLNFHMPCYGKIKVNLVHTSARTRLFAAGMGWYNAVKVKEQENNFAMGGGLGISGRNVDFTVYYKQGLGNNDNLPDKYVGASITYYFK